MEQENQFKIPEGLIGISEVYLPVEIILNLFLSFFLGLIVSLVYKKTHKGLIKNLAQEKAKNPLVFH